MWVARPPSILHFTFHLQFLRVSLSSNIQHPPTDRAYFSWGVIIVGRSAKYMSGSWNVLHRNSFNTILVNHIYQRKQWHKTSMRLLPPNLPLVPPILLLEDGFPLRFTSSSKSYSQQAAPQCIMCTALSALQKGCGQKN